MTRVFFVRHAQPNYANHNDLLRELSPKGLEDRKRVTHFLEDKQIQLVLSSPYKRAVDTVKDFADRFGFEIQTVEDFRERKVGGDWIEDFNTFAERQWRDFSYKLPDGESLGEVQRRSIAALNRVLEQHSGKNLVIGSHGTALSTIIHFYDPSFGYAAFEKIRDVMPWIVEFLFDGQRCVAITPHFV